MQRFERDARDTKIDLASAAVDDGTGSKHARSSGLQQTDHFAGAAAGGYDIFDHNGALVRADFEASAKRHFVRGAVAFSEERSDRKCTRNFVADNNAADGRSDCDINRCAVDDRFQLLGDFTAEAFCVGWYRED